MGSSNNFLVPGLTVASRTITGSFIFVALSISLAEFSRWPSSEVGTARVYDETIAESLSAYQHTEPHLVAPGESEFDGHELIENPDFYEHRGSFLGFATGAAYGSPVEQFCGDSDRVLLGSLPWRDGEADLVAVHDDVVAVKARRTCSGVDLGLDPLDVEVGESNPFTPSHNRKAASLFHRHRLATHHL